MGKERWEKNKREGIGKRKKWGEGWERKEGMERNGEVSPHSSFQELALVDKLKAE